MTNDFLPKGYEVPQTGGNYMKFEKGDNLFRVLSSAIVGWEYWNDERKPVRLKSVPDILPPNMQKDSTLKHFWAFLVWNYKVARIQVLEITQSTIQSAIQNLHEDVDWGSPKGYDIKITATGDNLEREYTVSPKPHTPLKSEIEALLVNTPYDLENLFVGGDPFKPTTSDGRPAPSFYFPKVN